MTASCRLKRPAGSVRRNSPAHFFAIGQAVRLRAESGQNGRPADIYHITGTLPPQGQSPQYRIRSDSESYERVATQDDLEPLRTPPGGARAALIERTFGTPRVTAKT